MSKKHPGTAQRNEYLREFTPEQHKKQGNQPPHHDWHEVEEMVAIHAPSKQKKQPGKSDGGKSSLAKRQPTSRKQPLL